MLFLNIVLGLLATYSIGFLGCLWAFRQSDEPVKNAAAWPILLILITLGLLGRAQE
jgi:hypothetical protein